MTVNVPWADPDSGFTALFESLVIDWVKEARTQAVSRQLNLNWNAIDGMMQRAVKRRLSRRDETAFRKLHDYVTIISDTENGVVLHVGQDRKKALCVVVAPCINRFLV